MHLPGEAEEEVFQRDLPVGEGVEVYQEPGVGEAEVEEPSPEVGEAGEGEEVHLWLKHFRLR